MSLAELAPTGTLRAGINMSNFLLVSGGLVDGVPVGVSPDLARAIADKLGVPIQLVPYPSPGVLADDAGKGVWDIGLIGAEPGANHRFHPGLRRNSVHLSGASRLPDPKHRRGRPARRAHRGVRPVGL